MNIRDIETEDWLLIALVAAILLPLGYQYATQDTATQTSNHPACDDLVSAVEGNLSQKFGNTSCECLASTNPNDPTLGDKANNTVTLQCTYPNGQSQQFELWVPNNQSAINETGVVR